MTGLQKWEGLSASIQLFSRQPVFSGVVFSLTILGMLTDSLGLITLVPLLDALMGSSVSSALSVKVLAWWQALGLHPELTGILLAFIFLMALRGVVRIAKDVAATRLRAQLTDDLRNEALAALMDAEWQWLGNHKRSDQANMLLTEVQRAGSGVFAALSLLATSAAFLAYLFVAVTIEPLTTAFAAGVGGLMLMLFSKLRHKALDLGQEQLSVHRRLHENALESIGEIKLAKILGITDLQLSIFGQSVSDLRQNQIRFSLLSGISRELFQVLGAILVAAYVFVGVSYWQMPLPELLVMVFIFARLVPMLTSFQQFLHMMTNALPALQEAENTIIQARAAAEPKHDSNVATILLTKELNLIGVNMCYSNSSALALKDVTMHLPARSTTVIMGPSGSGKSTLADVLMGLLQPNRGLILIDGIRLDGPDRIRWRQSVSYVPQEIILYAGTVRDNLSRMKPDATEAEIEAALAAASAEFVYTLPQGIDTQIGDGAHGLSGGEKQRLALARGLLRRPSLLVLDEITSALDEENEARICESLVKLAGQMTIVILGHRSAFLKIADQVLHLQNGELITEAQTV